MLKKCILVTLFLGLIMNGYTQDNQHKRKLAEVPIKTQWAVEVNPNNPLPGYPRPQMVRDNRLNLNGLWDYAVRAKEETRPTDFDGQILVPYPIESALSGVGKRITENENLWYRRTFSIPEHELIIAVWDPTDKGTQPRGKTSV